MLLIAKLAVRIDINSNVSAIRPMIDQLTSNATTHPTYRVHSSSVNHANAMQRLQVVISFVCNAFHDGQTGV
jgi:hypothetical protein